MSPTLTAMNKDFANYCCELLSSAGPCVARRMFGGWGISVDGMSIAIIADLGAGEKLWMKADDDTRAQWVAAGCARVTYTVTKKGVTYNMGMNYYSAPEDAMDSPDAMRPWARLALECAAKAMAVRLARRVAKAQPSKSKAAKKAVKDKDVKVVAKKSVKQRD